VIHYNGDLSKRPHLQACKQRGAQAFATRWHATDCSQCKVMLLGMPVSRLDDMTVIAMVSEVDDSGVELLIPAADGESAPDAQRLTFDAFENAWRVLR
jgi:hypothetical protein